MEVQTNLAKQERVLKREIKKCKVEIQLKRKKKIKGNQVWTLLNNFLKNNLKMLNINNSFRFNSQSNLIKPQKGTNNYIN